MLSYHAMGVSHVMHAEGGLTTERRSGTRAASDVQEASERKPGNEREYCKRGGHDLSPIGCSDPPLEGCGRGSSPLCVSQDDVVRERVPLLRIGGLKVDRQVDAQLPESELGRADVPECRAA